MILSFQLIFNVRLIRVLIPGILFLACPWFSYSQVPDSLLRQIVTSEDGSRLLSEYAELTQRKMDSRDQAARNVTEIFLELAKAYGTDRDLALAYRYHGLANRAREDNISAITCFLQELSLWEKLSDKPGLAEVSYNLGDCYRAIFDAGQADEYLKKAYSLFEELNDSLKIGKTLNRLAAVNIDSYQPERLGIGYEQAVRSLSMARKFQDYDLQISNSILIGSYFTQSKEHQKALEVLEQAIKLVPLCKEKHHLSLILHNMASSYADSKQFDKAIYYGNLAYRDALKNDINVYQWLSAWSLFTSYLALNIADSANKYQALGLQARVNIINEVMAKQKNILESKFLKEKYDLDLKNEKKQKRLVYIILIISFLSATTILMILFFRNRKLTGINRVLSEQNRIIESQKKELTTLTFQKDKFYSIIAHDLRSPFNGILGLTEILSEELKNLSDPQLLKMVEGVNHSATKLYQLLENLLQWAQLQQGILTARPEILPLSTLLHATLPPMLEAAEKKSITIRTDIPEDIFVFADHNMLESVFRNLIWNSIKFTQGGGEISIQAKPESEKMISVSVKDTGIGMNPAILENIFLFDKTTHRPGTHGEPSSGLGLMICKEFIAQNGGDIRVESEDGKGSVFTFTVPKN